MPQIEIRLTDETCGNCEFISWGECIITRTKRWKVTPGTYACNEYSEDESQQPLIEMTLEELGFRSDPTVGRELHLLGFRNTTIKVGDENG